MNAEKSILRTTAFTVALVASIVSVGLMLRACRFNDTGIALALIAIWILSPTIALVFADLAARRWLIFSRATVHGLMLVIASGSVLIYGTGVLGLVNSRAGFPYALIPTVSWLLIALVLAVAAFRTRIKSLKGTNELSSG
jgi:hypothetical protein